MPFLVTGSRGDSCSCDSTRSLLVIQGRKHPFLSSAHAVALMQEAKEEVVMMIASSLGDANQREEGSKRHTSFARVSCTQ